MSKTRIAKPCAYCSGPKAPFARKFCSEQCRFDDKWELIGECHVWTAGIGRGECPAFMGTGGLPNTASARRWLWETLKYELPPEIVVKISETCHKRCVRLDHLHTELWGTRDLYLLVPNVINKCTDPTHRQKQRTDDSSSRCATCQGAYGREYWRRRKEQAALDAHDAYLNEGE